MHILELVQKLHRRIYLGSILHARDVIQGNEATILVSTYSVVLLLTRASCQVQINIIYNCAALTCIYIQVPFRLDYNS
jgi:hypothetical protein